MVSKYTTERNKPEIKVDDIKTAAELIMRNEFFRESAPLFALIPSTAFCGK